IYSFYIFGPLQELGTIIGTYREAEASLANFENLMQTPKEPAAEHPKSIGSVEKLSFKDVSFKYQSGKENALQNISYDVSRGETIAFVGPSGSGKTSLVKLLVGLYLPTEGEI